MVALDTAVTWPMLADGASRAWRWWVGELLQAIPASVRDRLAPARPELLIHWDGLDAIVSQIVDGVLQNVATPGRIQGARVTLCVPPSAALRREIELPASARHDLRQIVANDLDRQTPFSPATALFDIAVRDAHGESDRLRVGLAVVKRQTINAALAACERLGLMPSVIAIGRPGSVDHEFNFLAGDRGRARLRPKDHPWLLFATAVVLLAALNIGLAFWRIDSRIDGLSGELVTLKPQAKITEKLRADLTKAEAEAGVMAEARLRPAPLETLKALTDALPDDVWLFEFSLDNGAGRIAGFAKSAADLIPTIDKSDILANPRFKSAVTRTDRIDADRFEIDFDLRARASK